MTVVYHELLPDSYLLILAPSRAGEPEAALAHSLHCAQRSGKAAVWVDCGMLHSLSDEAAQLLWGRTTNWRRSTPNWCWCTCPSA